MLSESFWRTRFNGDPTIVGRDLRLDGAPYNVVGVVPDSPQLIGKTDLWGLVSIQGAPPRARAARVFQGVGRLKPGVTLAAADADLSAVASALAQEYPKTNEGRGVTLEPFADAVIGADLRQTSMLFLGVVAFVLLICCANVANLLLARATVRSVMTLEDVAWEATGRHRFRAVLVTAFAGLALVLAMVGLFGILAYSVQRRIRDLGVRRALGATTGDVVRSVLSGVARVLTIGLLMGVALSVALGRVLESMLVGVQPLDPLTFVLVVAVLGLTALVAVAGPAWKATRVDPVVALRAE